MRERLTPEQKLQKDFTKQAERLGKVAVRWYELTNEIPNIQSNLVWRDDEGWSVRISQPRLGEGEVRING